jgi:hypothetical protein
MIAFHSTRHMPSDSHDSPLGELAAEASANRRLDDSLCCVRGEVSMSDPTGAIMRAICSAFESYPREGDPDWRSASWIMPEECAHLTNAIIRELNAKGFQIVKKSPDGKLL